ncbi:MAG: radical SAM protein [Planctomycetota bacterium]
MLPSLAKRLISETDWRCLAKFLYSFGLRGVTALRHFERRLKRNELFPPFLFISVTSACNLRCQGCWVTVDGPRKQLNLEALDKIIQAGAQQGNYSYGILGGEPLLHEKLTELFARHRGRYFLLFTNGTLITDSLARRLRKLGNVTPLVSIEGRESTSDIRRGGRDVYAASMRGLDLCRKHRLITGVATSLCKSNITELLTRRFIDELIDRGVHYLWLYIYRPVGADPAPELCLSPNEVLQVRRFVVETRPHVPILIVDAYWDADGRALCPAAAGVSFHIGPGGHVEPCPPIQFARENINNGQGIFDAINRSNFLRAFRQLALRTTPGCILLERPQLLRRFMLAQQACDSSGRGSGLAELASMACRASQHIPGREIPEKHWFYRWAKKRWLLGLGSYG